MQDGHKRLRTGRGAQDPRGTSPPPCPPISPTPGGPRPVPRLPLAAARGRSRYKRGRRRRRRQRRSMAGREAAAPVPAPHEGAAPQRAPHLHLAELSASQFLDVWRHFDTDGNGYIEGKELENFFQELESARKGAGVDSWKDKLGDKMKEFMHKYDKNADGKIEMAELAQILPTEENFLLCFRQHVGSSAEFMEAWRRYDTDRSGYIEANELKGFLSDLLKKANRPYDEPKLQEYTQTILRMFDMNGDGKLGLSEMSRLLPVQENFLLKFQGMKLSSEEFNAIFAFYDKVRRWGHGDEEEDVGMKSGMWGRSSLAPRCSHPAGLGGRFGEVVVEVSALGGCPRGDVPVPPRGGRFGVAAWSRAGVLLTSPCQDGSGFIDEHELDALLKDLYEKNKKVRGHRWGGRTPPSGGPLLPEGPHVSPSPRALPREGRRQQQLLDGGNGRSQHPRVRAEPLSPRRR
uniref:Calbindin 2 n=1 Tax=Cairina moschata TaxID=8855 RepID=A0A8C3CIN7_CAIMO